MSIALTQKQKAIALRKQGRTYSEILTVVPVAKSTLSLWLREVGLSKIQKQAITKKKRAAQLKGAKVRKLQRLESTLQIYNESNKDIGRLSQRELFLIGVVLYWAEGTKKVGVRTSVPFEFANSDVEMCKLIIHWLRECCQVQSSDIILRLHIHQSHIAKEVALKNFWAKKLGMKAGSFSQSVVKKHSLKTVRKNTGSDYIGLISIRVKKSTDLNRRIMGWIYAIIATQK